MSIPNIMFPYFDVNCVCGFEDRPKNVKAIMQCNGCKTWQHKDCLKAMVKMRNYLCPSCQVRKGGLFYNIVYTLLEPSLFQVDNKNNRCSFSFIPDTGIYPKINKIVKDDPEFIIIRCLRFDKNGFSFHWPKLAKIYMNNKLILDFTQKGSKRKDRTIALLTKKEFQSEDYINNKFLLYDANIVIIDDFIYDQKPNRIEIDVNYGQDDLIENTNFAISIDCVEIMREPNEIMKKVPTIHEKAKLRELLKRNEDENNVNVLASTKEKISLLDLYTESERIKIPARGVNCCHLNVFDLQTFLVLNRKTNKYQCPYCKRYANNLYVDGVILDFIQNKKNSDVDEILIDKEHNILSYLHKNTNEFVENDKSYKIPGGLQNREHFDPSKRFIVDLNSKVVQDSRSFFENKKMNIISNFGQIFDIIKHELNNNKNDRGYFTTENTLNTSRYNPGNPFVRYQRYNITKFPNEPPIIPCDPKNDNKDNDIDKNYKYYKELQENKNDKNKETKNKENNNSNDKNKKEVVRIYDLIEDENVNKDELMLPEFEEDESTEQSGFNKKETTFLNKKIKDIGSNSILHRSLFDSNGLNGASLMFQNMPGTKPNS